MSLERVFLEMGAGNDLHGGDYTKAALRAVDDALHHSSLGFARALGLDADAMVLHVTIGVARPEAVDAGRVAASLPRGRVDVRVVEGGLDVPGAADDDPAVIASAAIEVYLDLSGS